jgi:hypothetical protein
MLAIDYRLRLLLGLLGEKASMRLSGWLVVLGFFLW